MHHTQTAFVDTTMMLTNRHLIKQKAAHFASGLMMLMASRRRSLLPITGIRVVHSWAQAFGATLDEKLSYPVGQRFMRFAKKHC